jgi:hypothetical protein
MYSRGEMANCELYGATANQTVSRMMVPPVYVHAISTRYPSPHSVRYAPEIGMATVGAHTFWGLVATSPPYSQTRTLPAEDPSHRQSSIWPHASITRTTAPAAGGDHPDTVMVTSPSSTRVVMAEGVPDVGTVTVPVASTEESSPYSVHAIADGGAACPAMM